MCDTRNTWCPQERRRPRARQQSTGGDCFRDSAIRRRREQLHATKDATELSKLNSAVHKCRNTETRKQPPCFGNKGTFRQWCTLPHSSSAGVAYSTHRQTNETPIAPHTMTSSFHPETAFDLFRLGGCFLSQRLHALLQHRHPCFLLLQLSPDSLRLEV